MTDQEFAAEMRALTGQSDNGLAYMRSKYDRIAMADIEGYKEFIHHKAE